MASKQEQNVQDEYSNIPSLNLFSGHSSLQEHPWMATPPLYTISASIPFTWEEKPGKPRPPSTPLVTRPPHASNMLEPPPGRKPICYYQNKDKTSPDTVLEGPYNVLNSSSSDLGSYSFRAFLNEESLDSGKMKLKTKRLLFPSWKLRSFRNREREILGSSSRSFVFPSTRFDETTSDKSFNISRISRNGSLRCLSPKPHFWASLYQGFKYVIPWKSSRKSRKDILV